MVVALTPTAALAAPPPEQGYARVTDDRVDAAIQAGVAWLKAQRNPETQWERITDRRDRHWGGETALVILSLLYAGVDPTTEPWLRDAIYWLDRQALNGVYATGCRAHVFALLRGDKARESLQRDVRWLLDAAWPATSSHPGSYDYLPAPKDRKSGRWDNSVTQFGNLGVWMGAEAGVNVPREYWEAVGAHWTKTQGNDGGWQYESPPERGSLSTGSMTAAGLASLFVVLDYRYADVPHGSAPVVGAVNRGLQWLGDHLTPTNPRGSPSWDYYYLYAVERVGRASGYRYFGPHDWFRMGAAHLLEEQREGGRWPTSGDDMWDVRNTAFALMFLSHGRAPIMFSKLERAVEAVDRLRDVAGLTRYAKYALERPLNWQVVNLETPLDDLLEAPVLYLFGHEKRDFTPEETERIRDYCLRGGMLFGVVGEKGDGFESSFEQLMRSLFPDFPLEPLPANHVLFDGVQYKIENPPRLLAVDNGVRILALLCTRDIARSWSRFASQRQNESDLQLGVNVWLYASDKVIPRSRLQTPVIPIRERETTQTTYIARIQYNGNWDVESMGWPRLVRYMNNETAVRVLVMSGMSLAGDFPPEVKIAHMTGTRSFELTEAERVGLRRFISSGGTLIADAAGGSPAFTRAFEDEMRAIFGAEARELERTSFLITGRGIENAAKLTQVQFQRASLPIVGDRHTPLLRGYVRANRFAVLFSPLDLSAGMLGMPIYNLRGYDRDSTLAIMRNLLLYANLSTAEKAELQHSGN